MDFQAEYEAHFESVWRTLRRLGFTAADAQDASQEVFLIAFRRHEDFEGRSSVKTWLIGIAHGYAANHRRKIAGRHQAWSATAIEQASMVTHTEQHLEQRDQLRQLSQVLAQLSWEQRTVFTMFEMEGLTGEEIADALGVPLGTVRSRLRLAREAFIAASDIGASVSVKAAVCAKASGDEQ